MNKYPWDKEFFFRYVKALAAMQGVYLGTKHTDEYEAPGTGQGGLFRLLVMTNDLRRIKEKHEVEDEKAAKLLKKGDGKIRIWCDYGSSVETNLGYLWDEYLAIQTQEPAQSEIDLATMEWNAEYKGEVQEVYTEDDIVEALDMMGVEYEGAVEEFKRLLHEQVRHYYVAVNERNLFNRF